MLGAGIDARLGLQDYSGFTNAAAIQAQGMQNLGASIGDIGKQFGEYKKQQAADERMIQKSESVAKAIADLIPELEPTIQQSMMILGDKNIPLNRRKAEAEAIADILQFGTAEVKGRQEARAEAQKELMKSREVVGIENILYGNKTVQMAKMGDGTLRPVADVVQQYGEPLAPLPQEYETPADQLGMPVDMGVSADGGPGVLPPIPQLGVGSRFKEDTMQEKGTVMTPEQLQQQIAAGIKVNAIPTADGNYLVTGVTAGGGPLVSVGGSAPAPPPGYQNVFDPQTGNLLRQEVIPGGPAEAKQETKKEAQKQSFAFMQEFTDTASSALERIDDLPDNPILAKGASILGEFVPGTPSGRVRSRLETLKANLALSKINQMRLASPTGGSVGNMTEKEWPLLMQEFGNLDAAENKEDLKQRLQKAAIKVFNRVSGTPEERAEALRKGIITEEENAQTEQNYIELRKRLGIPEGGIPGVTGSALPEGEQPSDLFDPEIEDILKKYENK